MIKILCLSLTSLFFERMKAILVTLLRDIAFEWADPFWEVGKKTSLVIRISRHVPLIECRLDHICSLVIRPMIKSRLEEGHQLPLRLRIVRES